MAFGTRWIGLAGAVLAMAGCAFPLELAVDAWSWGEYWNQAGGEYWGEAGGEVRGSGDLVTESRAVPRSWRRRSTEASFTSAPGGA